MVCGSFEVSMQDFILCCGSTADLSHEHLKKRNIEYLPFHYFLDEKEYADDLGQTLPYTEFYAAMARGVMTRTSQINADEYETFFTPYLENGKDILYVSLSSGISGAYNSALIAQKSLSEKYPERKILVVDSLGASSGYGLLMDTLADLRDAGKSAEETAAWAEEAKLEVNTGFPPPTSRFTCAAVAFPRRWAGSAPFSTSAPYSIWTIREG